ncbi:MAG: transglutaminase-like domain-containing protein [Patescibacteria group bacterium]
MEEELKEATGERKKEVTAQLLDLKQMLSSLQQEPPGLLQADVKEAVKEGDGKNLLELRLFRALVSKYADIINDFEKKTVGEIKGMVNPDDLSVQSVLQGIKSEQYDFETGFEENAKKAFEFVKEEIGFVKLGIDVNFWLSPHELLREKIGDDKDIAVFLCSLLAGLGDENAEVIVCELSDSSTHAVVATEKGGKFFILDAVQKHGFEDYSGSKEEILEKYSFNSAKISRFLYRFNRQKYEQFI